MESRGNDVSRHQMTAFLLYQKTLSNQGYIETTQFDIELVRIAQKISRAI